MNDYMENNPGTETGNNSTPIEDAAGNAAAETRTADQQWSYTYGVPPETPPPVQPSPAPEKKKKRGGKAGLALLMVLCVLLSGAAGFGGSWYANELYAKNEASLSDTDTTQPSADSTADQNVVHVTSGDGLSYVELAAKVTPTVVQITTEYTVENFWMQQTATGAGSGVIISADGTVVTNNHVVEGANAIQVILSSGEVYPAELVASDAQTDIAVLKIDAAELPYAAMGTSEGLLVGQEVIAVGNPLGELGGTVTNGIISAVDRKITVDNYTMTLIQTNAAISPGNSGGGLFDASGNLIGIVNAKYADTNVEGLGFAIPIDIAIKSAQDLLDVGYVTGRVSVGLNLLDIQDQQTAFQYRVDRLGVYVYSTVDGSSAQTAGFKTGDYIDTVDGVEVRSADEIKAIFNEHEVGESIIVQVIRDGEKIDLTLILTEYAPAANN